MTQKFKNLLMEPILCLEFPELELMFHTTQEHCPGFTAITIALALVECEVNGKGPYSVHVSRHRVQLNLPFLRSRPGFGHS